MNLTARLKGWLVEHTDVDETASDDEMKKAATEAILSGKLSTVELHKLTTDEPGLADTVKLAVTEVVAPIKEAVDGIGIRVADLEKKPDEVIVSNEPEHKEVDIEALLQKHGDGMVDRLKKAAGSDTKDVDNAGTKEIVSKLFGGSPDPDVITPDSKYSSTKAALFYPKDCQHQMLRGMPATHEGKQLETPSELDLAIVGSYFRFAATRNGNATQVPRWLRMTDEDRYNVRWAMENMKFTGLIGGDGTESGATKIDGRKLSGFEVKALLDDATSGAQEAVPTVFDAAVIITPVLHGELYPLVNVIPIGRGSAVDAFSIGNPTITSGTAEGTAIGVFDTSSMISAFDTTIYNAVGAMEIGQDLEADSPVALGSLVVQRYGEKTMEWLDNQIANGDGTSEPQGLFNASGTTDIGNPTGGANAAPQITDYETLMFNVAKAYRPASERGSCVFVANDTSYQRARSIAVGGSDARRIFGMTHEDYMLLGHGFKVQNDIANTDAGFFNLRHYRMYRRLGLTVRVETGGKELARKNLTLIVVRMRFGGKIELGGYGSYSDNWQT